MEFFDTANIKKNPVLTDCLNVWNIFKVLQAGGQRILSDSFDHLLLTLCDFPFEFGDLPLGIFAYNRSFYSSIPHFKLEEKKSEELLEKETGWSKSGAFSHFPTTTYDDPSKEKKERSKKEEMGAIPTGHKKRKRKEDSLFFSSLFRTKEKLFCLFFLFPSSLLPIFSAIVCS